MRSFLWNNKWLFLLGTLAGWGLRGYFLKHHALIEGDSLIYGEIAKNWLQNGIFGLAECGEIVPTLIRLPAYPAFLAAIFEVATADADAVVVEDGALRVDAADADAVVVEDGAARVDGADPDPGVVDDGAGSAHVRSLRAADDREIVARGPLHDQCRTSMIGGTLVPGLRPPGDLRPSGR